MPQTLADTYGDLQSNKCREHRCAVQLNYFVSYCGESMRDRVLGNSDLQIEMCDCIVTNNKETKISLVELKDRRSKTIKINYNLVNKTRDQFCGGLDVLRKAYKEIGKSEAYLQLVLFTKLNLERSELKRLRRPLPGLPHKITIINRACGCDLPDQYLRLQLHN